MAESQGGWTPHSPLVHHGLRRLMALELSLAVGGCADFGAHQLDQDQLEYSRALLDSDKKQTLLNIIRLRYADTPTFLDVTQIISGYQLQRAVTGGFELFPNAPPGTFLSGTGSAQLQQSPTFTFEPVTGTHFAESVLRPIAPTSLLPLAQSGLPIDVLLRLAVQSIGPLLNTTGLLKQGGEGSPGFFLLLRDFRKLQIAGALGIRLQQGTVIGADGKREPGPDHVYVSLAPERDAMLRATAREVRRLLSLPSGARETEVLYGRFVEGRSTLPMLTRSVLGVLGQIAAQAEVPAEDVARGLTLATIGQVGVERRPVVAIQAGQIRPADPFTAVEYDRRWYWIDRTDFDSKLAFSMVGLLLALAKTSTTSGAVVTIPAG